jgi:hypothetical protein
MSRSLFGLKLGEIFSSFGELALNAPYLKLESKLSFLGLPNFDPFVIVAVPVDPVTKIEPPAPPLILPVPEYPMVFIFLSLS